MPRTLSHVVAREDTAESRLAKSLKLVPAFEESKVTEWFWRFEKKAPEFEWPQSRWVGLVANVLKGKALEAYDRMNVEVLENYEEFKSTILRVYELRPEAYHMQFRGARKRPTDTYQNCALYLEETLEKWLLSEDVDSFKSLKELILMEFFTNLADKEIETKIRKKRFRTVTEAATWADDRVLALTASEVKPVNTCATPFTRDKHASGAAWSNRSTCQWKEKKECDKSYQAKSSPSSSRLTCFYCKQEGYIKPNCAKWRHRLPSLWH